MDLLFHALQFLFHLFELLFCYFALCVTFLKYLQRCIGLGTSFSLPERAFMKK